MANPSRFEKAFERFMQDLTRYIPDGIIPVNLELLQSLDLLKEDSVNGSDAEEITRFFHVVESPEKITLFNERFVIWIVPQVINGQPYTAVLIALNTLDEEPRLEMAFSTSGIYNTSKLVLRILEKFLLEIQENEQLLTSLDSE